MKKILISTILLYTLILPYNTFSEIITKKPKNITKVDKIVIYKGKRQLLLLKKGQVFKSYKVALGQNPIGHKIQEGDNKTPEGLYIIDGHNPKSSFHLSLRISYPSPTDRKNSLLAGLNPGGNIMIHGIKNGTTWIEEYHRNNDWTDGCIAVSNEEIREIYSSVTDGTPIEIQP